MRDQPQPNPYPLRMPDELRRRLEAAAKERNQSLHAEILMRLSASLDESESGSALTQRLVAAALRERAAEISRALLGPRKKRSSNK